MQHFPRTLVVAMSAVLVATLGVGILMSVPDQAISPITAAENSKALEARDALATGRPTAEANQVAQSFQTVVQAMRPSVVSIASVKKFKPALNGGGRMQVNPGIPEEFRRFFDDDIWERFQQSPRGGRGMAPRGHEQRGEGSGVIVTETGYVITNNHVVSGADEVTVTLADDRSFSAEVVGTDPQTDVAVIKIEAAGLIPAPLGNSDRMQVGEWVLAMGSPFGLKQTVTSGIVSAKGRANVGVADYEDFIQTDAAINPGNSGGPLVNLRGEVIGINTAIASRSGGYQGIGFAIPSNMVRMIMGSIIEHGSVDRGWLGAAIQDLTKELSASFKFGSTHGVLIGDVVRDSPAEKAGLKSGDIVTSFNGREVHTANQLRNTVAGTKPGVEAPLEIFRDGRNVTLNVVVGHLEKAKVAAAGSTGGDKAESPDSVSIESFGLTVAQLTPELAERQGWDAKVPGVVVTDVLQGSAAERVGIQPGDMITAVNSQAIASLDDWRAVTKDVDLENGLRLQVKRDGVGRFVFLQGDK